MRARLRTIAQHNEAMADRNWELQEAEQRARTPVRGRRTTSSCCAMLDGRITYANDAYCELAQFPRSELIGSTLRR